VLLEDDTSTPPPPSPSRRSALRTLPLGRPTVVGQRPLRPDPSPTPALPQHAVSATPTLYVLNAAAITKPHATEHLTADLKGYNVDVAVITETHLKKKHADHHVTVDGYALFRRDRVDRRGGGIAVYVNSRLSADVWPCPGDSAQFELL